MNKLMITTSSSCDAGFTLVELVLVIIIMGLILSIGVLSYANVSRDMKLHAAKNQVSEAINRAKLSARQENVDYRITFYPSDDAAHANTYEVQHSVYDEGSGSWSMQPANKSVSGEKVIESNGHFYVEVLSPTAVTSGGTIEFHPSGTMMTVPTVTGSDGKQTIGLSLRGKTASVSVDAQANITER
jgi:prepilin-type N-terminal cleavage/methylation domain-containing protein